MNQEIYKYASTQLADETKREIDRYAVWFCQVYGDKKNKTTLYKIAVVQEYKKHHNAYSIGSPEYIQTFFLNNDIDKLRSDLEQKIRESYVPKAFAWGKQ